MFRYFYKKGYQGLIGMEHGASRPGPEGEQAVIDAFVEVDGFEQRKRNPRFDGGMTK